MPKKYKKSVVDMKSGCGLRIRKPDPTNIRGPYPNIGSHGELTDITKEGIWLISSSGMRELFRWASIGAIQQFDTPEEAKASFDEEWSGWLRWFRVKWCGDDTERAT